MDSSAQLCLIVVVDKSLEAQKMCVLLEYYIMKYNKPVITVYIYIEGHLYLLLLQRKICVHPEFYSLQHRKTTQVNL